MLSPMSIVEPGRNMLANRCEAVTTAYRPTRNDAMRSRPRSDSSILPKYQKITRVKIDQIDSTSIQGHVMRRQGSPEKT